MKNSRVMELGTRNRYVGFLDEIAEKVSTYSIKNLANCKNDEHAIQISKDLLEVLEAIRRAQAKTNQCPYTL